MAEVLSDFEFGRGGSAKRYDQFLDGQVWKVTLLELGAKRYASAQSMIHRRAKSMGKKLRTHDGGDFIVIQAISNGDGQK